MFKEKVMYSINRIQELLDKQKKKYTELQDSIEETMLFESSFKHNTLSYSYSTKAEKILSKIEFIQIIINELKKIKVFKQLSGDAEEYLSIYGSLYCGDGNLYYNDVLVNYNKEEFLQIILNHIFHYVHDCVATDRNEILIKSCNLLSFYHLGMIDYKIAYSNKYRSSLYVKPEYSKIINDYIIFVPNKNYKEFIINNVCDTSFYRVFENNITGVYLHVTESGISKELFNTKIKKSIIKNTNRRYSNSKDILSQELEQILRDNYSNMIKQINGNFSISLSTYWYYQ